MIQEGTLKEHTVRTAGSTLGALAFPTAKAADTEQVSVLCAVRKHGENSGFTMHKKKTIGFRWPFL